MPPYRARTYAYCSDTRPNKDNLPLLREVDLLYHETTFAQSETKLAHKTFHTTTVQAAELAAKAGVGKLLIGHFSSRYKKISALEEEARRIFNDTVAVNDGDVFAIEQVRQTD
jgi:ribonuclease Z